MIAVAFCADRNVEAALHVAASSLLRNLNPTETVRFYLLLTGFSEKHLQRLRDTLDRTGREYELRLPQLPDTPMLREFRPLHGNLVPYHRLLLPEVVDEDRLLYLDSDTLTAIDISPLFSLPMADKATAFVVDSVVGKSMDCKFLVARGLRPTSPGFNSGVMLFNLEQWRKQRCTQRSLDLCRESFKHDQVVLNLLFSEDTCSLPAEYNIKLYPSTPIEGVAPGIYHFLGSPKPWDIAGNRLVNSYALWHGYARHIVIKNNPWLSSRAWLRSFRILGSYRRELEAQLSR
jgi:lipopolysaccharide biosynthesis glycosyltransferase